MDPGRRALLVLAVIAFWLLENPNYDGLKAQGNAIVEQIERYHAAHGEYPRSLEEAHIRQPLTLFGHWQYEREPVDSYWLWVGDYGRNGFTLHYIPNRGWDLDT